MRTVALGRPVLALDPPCQGRTEALQELGWHCHLPLAQQGKGHGQAQQHLGLQTRQEVPFLPGAPGPGVQDLGAVLGTPGLSCRTGDG